MCWADITGARSLTLAAEKRVGEKQLFLGMDKPGSQDKELQLDEFVTHEIRFEEINKAFDLLIEGKCLRCVIYMTNE
ncbi:hypothetical protein L3X38_008756 [Prunus dulcis]|uniref:Uncharacterized protein n=1 Tax=Prunus dulcis TaxID=3755 RepID=A0AAD5F754_PRUDU|nr:hypothetical protein L3X38_008756 [Prunus dulcis]